MMGLNMPAEGTYEYKLKETKAPEGYNVLKDEISFAVTYKFEKPQYLVDLAKTQEELDLIDEVEQIKNVRMINGENDAEVSNGNKSIIIEVYNGNEEEEEKEEPLYLTTEEYTIANAEFEPGSGKNYEVITENEKEYNDGDKYILGIMPYIKNLIGEANENNEGTTIERFKEKIETNADEIQILTEDGTEIKDENELIATGQILKLTKAKEQEITLRLIVRGDCWGRSLNRTTGAEGQLMASDYTRLKLHVADMSKEMIYTEIKAEYLRLALDVNMDNRINARDITFVGRAITNYDNRYLISNIIN